MLNALECNEYSALCLLYISIAAPDQRPMIRCQRIHRESRPWDFFWPGASVPEKTQAAACGGRGKTRAATFPYHCAASPTPIPSQEQAVFVQDDVGIRMEVLCNGRVGDLLAELSGREVIELLGRYICSTFSFSRRTLRREAGLVLKNVANLCRYTYLSGGGRQIVGRPHSWIMYFTLKMFASPTKCASPTINPWRRHCRNTAALAFKSCLAFSFGIHVTLLAGVSPAKRERAMSRYSNAKSETRFER